MPTLSVLKHARNCNIGSVRVKQVAVSDALSQKELTALLADNIAVEATRDAAVRVKAPKCYPKTRVKVRAEIGEWMDRDRAAVGQKILWVTGPAGTGKTAIAGTLAETWKKGKALAATFFFSALKNSSYCQSKKRFITTLVYQLIQHPGLTGLRGHVLAAIQGDPAVFQKLLKEQVEILILGPLRKIDLPPCEKFPTAILIDGLDECEACEASSSGSMSSKSSQESKEEVHEEILSTLLYAANDPSFLFRIIVASRPDSTIQRFFSLNSTTTTEIFLDEKYKPDADIARFAEGKFSEIRDRFGLKSWPKNEAEVVRTLVRNASGQFVYVATAIRYIETGGRRDNPQAKLDRILDPDAAQRYGSPDNPFARLDALYECILSRSPDPALAVKWLHAILELHSESGDSVTTVTAFLESRQGEMWQLLGNLSSLLRITDTTFQFFHKSLLDYLSSKQRSRALHVSSNETLAFLQERWYRILKNRGPQIPLRGNKRHAFMQHYAGPFTMRYYLPSLPAGERYGPADIQWWISVARSEPREREDKIDRMQVLVHEKCSWYRCLSHCRIWRPSLVANIGQEPLN